MMQILKKMIHIDIGSFFKGTFTSIVLYKNKIKIKVKELILNNLSQFKSFFEHLTGYKWFQFQDSLACSSFFLILTKITLSPFFFFSPLVNISILFTFWIIAIKYDFHYSIRKIFFLLLFYTVGTWYKGYGEGSWKEIVEDDTCDFKLEDVPKDYWYHKLSRTIFTTLIYIRLCIYTEPYIYFILRTIICYLLIFNKLLIITFFISLIGLSSRFLLLTVDKTYEKLKENLSYLNEEIKEEKATIAPTWMNATYLLCWVTRPLEIHCLNYQPSFEYINTSYNGYYCIDLRLDNLKYPVIYREALNIEKPYFTLKKENSLLYYFFLFIIIIIIINYLIKEIELINTDLIKQNVRGSIIVKTRQLFKVNKNDLNQIHKKQGANTPHSPTLHDGLIEQNEKHIEISNTTTIKSSYNKPSLNLFSYNETHAIVGTTTIFRGSLYDYLPTSFNLMPASKEQITAWENNKRYPRDGQALEEACKKDYEFYKHYKFFTNINSSPAAQSMEFVKPFQLPLLLCSELSLAERCEMHTKGISLCENLAKRKDLSLNERAFYKEQEEFLIKSSNLDSLVTPSTLIYLPNDILVPNFFSNINKAIEDMEKYPKEPIINICENNGLDTSKTIKTYNKKNDQTSLKKENNMPFSELINQDKNKTNINDENSPF